jgi:adenylosuccinate lyase
MGFCRAHGQSPMINRYVADWVHQIWNRQATLDRWCRVEIANAAVRGASDDVLMRMGLFGAPSAQDVDELESEHGGHEMVAFLAAWTEGMPDDVASWVHRSMTTSDVTDTATSMAMAEYTESLDARLEFLSETVVSESHDRLARTHGQPAALTDLRHQTLIHKASLTRARHRIVESTRRLFSMSSGPVGADPVNIGSYLGLTDVGTSSQAMPRDAWSEWLDALVSCLAVLENYSRFLWMGIRDGELIQLGGVTSSSMPHKSNPTKLERVWGMARLGRGYRSALAESIAMWDERDLAQSSVERVAIPGLCAALVQATDDVLDTLTGLGLHTAQMDQTALHAPDSHRLTTQYQKKGMSYMDARAAVRDTLI